MTQPGDGAAVVLLATQGPTDAERMRQRLESAGVRVVAVASEAEARRAAADLGVPAPPGELAQMVVHHLKGPLTGLFATLEMLADGDLGELTDRQRVAIEDLRARGEEMLALVDDLLQLWRAESPSLELAREPLVPGELLRAVAAEWGPAFVRANTRLLVEEGDPLPAMSGDFALLRRVFGNLLHNVLQHASAASSVRLRVRADGTHILYSVADDGPGIPPAYRDAIFRRFARVPRADGRGARGTGLGLAFCRLAVLAHGGTIWVESREGAGTTFHVRLPAEPMSVPGGGAA